MSELRIGTRVLRAGGKPAATQGTPFLAGPTFAAPFHFAGDDREATYTYGRTHNPTWTAFEAALCDLEGGADALVFASGMAAIAAVCSTVLAPGDVLLLPDDGYYATRAFARDRLSSTGVDVRTFATTMGVVADDLRGVRLLLVETPTNPGLDVCDIAAICAAAHEVGALVAVDNTTATVALQTPLALGADFSVASDTKALTGHADLVLGHVASADEVWAQRLRAYRTQTGAIAGPMEVWLAHRSLATLDVRLERQCTNALAIASLLQRHGSVANVRYPGLAGDPSHAIAARQMRAFGPVVSFMLADRSAADRFFAQTSLFYEATSFGGVHSSAERRARWEADAVSDAFVRLSAGCEDIADLLADLAHGLDAACA